MKLEDITAEIRPRTPWEAVDLGCVLARHDFWKILAALAVTVLPLCLILITALHNHLAWALLCIWWLKPLFDRVSLHYLSQSLFGAPPPIKTTLKQWPAMVGRYLLSDWSTLIVAGIITLVATRIISRDLATIAGVIAVLTFMITSLATRRGRFLPWRSFLLPLTELERLKGKQFTARSKVLFRRGSEEATWLTISCILMEFVVSLGLLFLALSFIPQGQGVDTDRIVSGLTSFEGVDVPPFVLAVLVGLYLVAVTIVGIFYTGAGFGLYLNSRTILEGWDVELSFRKLAARVSNSSQNAAALTLALATVATTLALATPMTAAAAAVSPSPEDTIDSVLADEDFIIHKGTRKELVDSDFSSWDFSGFSIFQILGQLLFWAVTLAVVVGLAVLIYKNRHIFTARGRLANREKFPQPKARTLMGMNVAPETLPDDIAKAARDAWNSGHSQKALSLLYRGSLCWLIERENLPVHESDTEGDCVRHATLMQNRQHSEYFSELTNHWIRLVYAKRLLHDDEVSRLCDEWPFDLRRPGNP
jgi:hypothetical protein